MTAEQGQFQTDEMVQNGVALMRKYFLERTRTTRSMLIFMPALFLLGQLLYPTSGPKDDFEALFYQANAILTWVMVSVAAVVTVGFLYFYYWYIPRLCRLVGLAHRQEKNC